MPYLIINQSKRKESEQVNGRMLKKIDREIWKQDCYINE